MQSKQEDTSTKKESISPKKWLSKQKKNCKISWTEVQNAGTKEEKKIVHSYAPKEWCKLITKGLPVFKDKRGVVVCHAEFAYKEYMSGSTFEESIEKVKTYSNNVRNSYVGAIKKFRLETFIKICEQHYNDNKLEITVQELKEYQFTDLEIDEYTNHMAEQGVLDIIEEDGKKQYILKSLDAIGNDSEIEHGKTEVVDETEIHDKIEDVEEPETI